MDYGTNVEAKVKMVCQTDRQYNICGSIGVGGGGCLANNNSSLPCRPCTPGCLGCTAVSVHRDERKKKKINISCG